MVEDASEGALERIDAALARLTQASRRHVEERRGLAARHAALRTRIGLAIEQIDAAIARGDD